MKLFARCGGILILLALIMSPLLAQDDPTISVVGSGIVQPLFQALADANESQTNLNMNVTGTSTGFMQFCAGEADITTAARAMTSEESTSCNTNNQTYFELLIGQDIAAFIANPGVDFAQCLTRTQLNSIFAPSAEGQTTNWQQIFPEAPDTPLTVLIPSESTSIYTILDQVVEGDGIREDASVIADSAELFAAVSENPGTIGVARLSDVLASDQAMLTLDLNAAAVGGCQSPTPENVEDDLYPAANQLRLYINTNSLSKPGLADLLNNITTDEAAQIITEQGFIAPTSAAIQKNIDTLQAAISGEPIVQTGSEYTVPIGVTGTVNVGGAANVFDFIKAASDTFSATNSAITINTKIEGEPAGFRRLCNGEIEITTAYRDFTEKEAGNCAANNITTIPINLGNQSVVLVANAANDYLACLTTDQIATIWRAESADTVNSWNQVSADFPETPLMLFAPANGSPDTDLLLIEASGSGLISRADTAENNADSLYRAAAIANVDGGLTYMSWQDYQSVLGNNQANIQLVAVDSGSGCVTPDENTIIDGTYALTRPGQLVINKLSLAKPEVQAFAWYLMSNENFPNLESNGFIGLRFGDLDDIRANLQQAFSEAELEAIQRAAEATPEATVEATAEATEAAP
jgi:phosphate transport system substrate-binding protein